MATTIAQLQAVLHADTKAFDRAMGKSESRMQKTAKVAGIAGLAIAGGLAVAFKVGIDEMNESARVMGQTEAVIKSTGGAANVTAEHVDAMSQKLLELSGVDDELISSSQNVLLTFRDIRNEVGAGNDIFDQATLATLDFSTAMGLDLNNAALSVGKALNNPIRGMTKLERQGVTFTDAQKEMIKQLQESGDTMGAQKIILEELRKEFGGSAEAAGKTLPAQLNRAREAFADVSAALVEQLLPAMTAAIEYFSRFLTFLKEHPGVAKVLVIALGLLAGALITASVAATLLNLAFLASPIGLVVLAIAALIAGLVVLYMKFEIVRRAVDFVRDHWRLLLFAFGLLPGVIMLIVTHFGTLKAKAMPVLSAIRAAFDNVKEAAGKVKDFIVGTLWPRVSPILGFFRDRINGVKDAFQGVVDVVRDLIGWISDLIGKINDIPSPGGIIGGIVDRIPGRASGGPVAANRPYIVGERRAELFVPSTSGTIVPAVGGGGTVINLVVPRDALVLDGGKLVRYLDEQRQRYGRRGGR